MKSTGLHEHSMMMAGRGGAFAGTPGISAGLGAIRSWAKVPWFLLMLGAFSCGKEAPGGAASIGATNLPPAQVTFVELGSENCTPCRMMKPVMKAVEESYGGKVRVVFHDVWTAKGKGEGKKYGIRVIPTQVFLDGQGVEFYRHEGFLAKAEIDRLLVGKIR